MINVNQITSQLARMPDQALQKYAQMHKNDPYIMALAMSESNRRKDMRGGAQMNAPQQPKIVDQAIQGMAAPMPENVGIGQLPAGDMNFADGGIVAFAGGGTPDFNTSDAEEIRKLAERRLRAEQLRAAMGSAPGAGAAPAAGSPGFFQYMKDKLSGLRPTGLAGWGFGAHHGELNANEDAELRKRQAMGATIDPTATDVQQAMDAGSFARPNAGAAGAKGPGQRVPPAGAPGGATPAAAPAAAPAATTPAQGGLADLQKTYEDIAAKQTYKDPAAERLGALEAKETAAAQADKAALERDQTKFAEAFKGREARLGKREADIGEQKDTNTNLALLNAGLAIMSTPGGLATALGKGAQVGTAHFAAGLDKIRSAQDKLDEARDRMEELKLNRDEMNAKEIRAAESKIRNVGIDGEKRAIDGIRQAAQVNRETAKAVFDKTAQLGITQLEIAGRERVANIAAAATRDNSAATRAATEGARMATLAESVRKNIAAEALKKFPYDTNAQATYEQQALQAALRTNPGLAQYLGTPGGGGASAGGTDYSKWGNLSTGKP